MTKPKWLDDHACAYNDGNCECKCFVEGYKQGQRKAALELEASLRNIFDNPKDK